MKFDDLKKHDNWIAWKMHRDGDRLIKTPVDVKSGGLAASDNPATWATFADAERFVSQGLGHSIGFALTKEVGLVIVDFDKVCPEGGYFPKWVRDEINDLDSYTEVSASKRGAHVLVWATIPKNFNRQNSHIEIWGHDKMFALSGDIYEGRDVIQTRDVSSLHRRIDLNLIGPEAGSAAPHAPRGLLVKAPVDLDRLLNADDAYINERYRGDMSEADLGAVAALARKTNGDRQEIERLWLASPLGQRPKTQSREDYRERTIDKALSAFVPAVIPKQAEVDPDDWRGLFHSYDELVTAPPLRFAITNFLQEDGITFIGGLPGHGKTLVMLSVVKALLTGGNLFACGGFKVTAPASRVIYLVPESGLGPFKHRLELFGLLEWVKSGKLFVRTMSRERISLADPRVLKAAEGADVFLDTAVRFMEGAENAAEDNRVFANTLFDLQGAGARTITGAHHSPKAFENRETISLENVLRGSGDIGAMLATAWGIKQVDTEHNKIFVKCVKARDFEPGQPFEITGRPFIDQDGDFVMTGQPGLVVMPSKKKPKKTHEVAAQMKELGHTHQQIAEYLKVNVRTVERWEAQGLLGEPAVPAGRVM